MSGGRSEGSTANKRSESTGDAKFDPHSIARMEHVLKEKNSQWQSYFQDNGIVPLVIYYEDLVADYAGTIVSVLKWLGIANPDTIVVPPSRLRQQSDDRNEEWLTRYTAFKSEGGHFARTPASDGPMDPCLNAFRRPSKRYRMRGSSGLGKVCF